MRSGPVITSFQHKGLKLPFEEDDRSKVLSTHADKIARILARLDEATEPASMNLPGFKLHPLTGERSGFWAVSVTGNFRITWRFEGTDVADVDLTDYHKGR